MRYLLTLLAAFSLAGTASAAGQYGETARASAMLGSYAGLGGIVSYTVPINAEGLSRSGLGLVGEAQLGAGLDDDEFTMSSMLGLNLVFVMSSDFDVYGGLGAGSRLLPDNDVGIGGKLGVNFVASRRDLFVEAGSHPSAINYIGVGMRF